MRRARPSARWRRSRSPATSRLPRWRRSSKRTVSSRTLPISPQAAASGVERRCRAGPFPTAADRRGSRRAPPSTTSRSARSHRGQSGRITGTGCSRRAMRLECGEQRFVARRSDRDRTPTAGARPTRRSSLSRSSTRTSTSGSGCGTWRNGYGPMNALTSIAARSRCVRGHRSARHGARAGSFRRERCARRCASECRAIVVGARGRSPRARAAWRARSHIVRSHPHSSRVGAERGERVVEHAAIDAAARQIGIDVRACRARRRSVCA